MKFNTTKKEIMENYGSVISVGYCDLQYLLEAQKPIAYTCGVYGWNADIYEMPVSWAGTAIVTGYRPFGNIKPDYATVRKYDEQAREICGRYEIDYKEREKMVNELLVKFVKEVQGE